MAGGAAQGGRSVTSRALAVLGAFDTAAPRLSLSEIAERSAMPLTTVHRLLGELTDWGALQRRPDGRYEIGRRLWDLGLLAPVSLELRQVAAPFLLDVHTATRDTVHLAVRDGTSALYVPAHGFCSRRSPRRRCDRGMTSGQSIEQRGSLASA